MAGCVVSVERATITLTSPATSGAHTLTKGQTLANCVVFMSYRVGSDVNSSMQCDAELTTGPDAVTVSRVGTASDVVANVTVVEFDPAQVTVQQGTWTIAAAAATGATVITAIERDDSFMIAHWKTTDTTDDPDSGCCRFQIETDEDGVQFLRIATDGDVSGHFYVATALSGQWTVQHLSAAFLAATTDQEIAIGTPVDTALSFAIASFSSSTGSDLSPHNPNIGLEDTDNLQFTRLGVPNASGTVWAQVIEFADSSVANVQHGNFSLADTVGTDNDTITSVDTDRAMAISCLMKTAGANGSAGVAGRALITAEVRLTDATTVTGQRQGTANAWEMYWQVIEWELAAAAPAFLATVAAVLQLTSSVTAEISPPAPAPSAVEIRAGSTAGRGRGWVFPPNHDEDDRKWLREMRGETETELTETTESPSRAERDRKDLAVLDALDED